MAVTTAVLSINKEIADLKDDVEKKGYKMIMMDSRLAEVKQQSCSNTLKFDGIPQKDCKTIENAIIRVAKEHLGAEVKLARQDKKGLFWDILDIFQHTNFKFGMNIHCHSRNIFHI